MSTDGALSVRHRLISIYDILSHILSSAHGGSTECRHNLIRVIDTINLVNTQGPSRGHYEMELPAGNSGLPFYGHHHFISLSRSPSLRA